MRTSLYVFAGLLLMAGGCDRIKAVMDAHRPAPEHAAELSSPTAASYTFSADPNSSNMWERRAGIEAIELAKSSEFAARKGKVLTIFHKGEAIATFEDYETGCDRKDIYCANWTYLGTYQLRNPATGKIEAYAHVDRAAEEDDYNYVVDHDGAVYFVGSGDMLISPGARSGATQDLNVDGDGSLSVLDWSDAKGRTGYTFKNLCTPVAWSDDKTLNVVCVDENNTYLHAIVFHQAGGWTLRSDGAYAREDVTLNGQDAPVPRQGAKIMPATARVEEQGLRQSAQDFLRDMTESGYRRLKP